MKILETQRDLKERMKLEINKEIKQIDENIIVIASFQKQAAKITSRLMLSRSTSYLLKLT